MTEMDIETSVYYVHLKYLYLFSRFSNFSL
jgi:hypothetical protein